MTQEFPQTFVVQEGQTGTIVAELRRWLPGYSWSDVRRLLRSRRVSVNAVLCVDEARRLMEGETVTVTAKSLPAAPTAQDVDIRLVDSRVVVAEKPAGMITVRHASERKWSSKRRYQQPTLHESVALLIGRHRAKRTHYRGKLRRPHLYPVHRLDRDTSGLVVLARDELAQRSLIEEFAERKAERVYRAVVLGHVKDQTIRSWLVRDRGDGLRGSSPHAGEGDLAVTHVRTIRSMGAYSELECRLETGRTNQIRIHLTELGHPICGDIKYRSGFGEPPVPDDSGAPRLALHATRLAFRHPETGSVVSFESYWPQRMEGWIRRVVAGRGERSSRRRSPFRDEDGR